ncbi:MAG: flagellar export chaperone FliS [Desulfovibrionaceae bacterium]|nr:flagellar export chaperone FliS [Desulfovibrionaceae bacterium]
MNKAAQAYFQTKVSTTDQGRLLLMLYDGALQFLQQAREKMLEKDYAAKGLLISRVIDIVNELSGSLNMEKGGTLAENLNNLYFLCTARLLQANLKMDVKQLDSVVGILSGLRSAYAEIIDKPEAKQAVAQIAQKMQPEASMVQRAAPITSPLSAPATVSQFQARQAYGGSRNAPAPTPGAAASGLVAAPAHLPPPPAPAPTPSFTDVAKEAGLPVPEPRTATPAAPSTPGTPGAGGATPPTVTPTPSPAPAAPGGFGKRLAAYNRLSQNR